MSISLKKSVVTISAADKDPPGCPDADSVNIETISFLINLDIDFNSSTLLTICKPPLQQFILIFFIILYNYINYPNLFYHTTNYLYTLFFQKV